MVIKLFVSWPLIIASHERQLQHYFQIPTKYPLYTTWR